MFNPCDFRRLFPSKTAKTETEILAKTTMEKAGCRRIFQLAAASEKGCRRVFQLIRNLKTAADQLLRS